MKVLVAYATKMGGTREIAEAIGDELRRRGLTVTVVNARDIANTDGFDALVLGSALYTSRWRREAVALLARDADQQRAIPTWLFQSGPCGTDAAKQLPAPKQVSRLAERVGAEQPITFGGRLLPETAKGFLVKKMAKGPLAGDFRDFAAIRAWAVTSLRSWCLRIKRSCADHEIVDAIQAGALAHDSRPAYAGLTSSAGNVGGAHRRVEAWATQRLNR